MCSLQNVHNFAATTSTIGNVAIARKMRKNCLNNEFFEM